MKVKTTKDGVFVEAPRAADEKMVLSCLTPGSVVKRVKIFPGCSLWSVSNGGQMGTDNQGEQDE